MANQVDGDSLDLLSTATLARGGDLRAIARWLNACLVPQRIYARVGVTKPGYLKVVVEFERSPERDRLIRFVCHRLCKLNSSHIKAVQIVAQWVGTSKIVWKQSVRINTPANRTSNPSPPLLPAARSTTLLKQRQAVPLGRSVSQQLRSRSLLLGGSAAAAFLVGCGFEVLIQHAGALASQSGETEATEVSTSQLSERTNTVQTAQDEVTVFQQPVLNPDDPTVTLTFGDDAALGTIGATSTLQVSSTGGSQSSRADVATAHLDAPLMQIQPDSLDDETAPEQLQTLIDSQVDLVSLASTQVMEEGADGLEETLKTLDQFGIHSVGAGRDRREASRPEILDVKGQRIAYLGYSDSDLNAAGGRSAGVNANPNRRVAADIQAIRDQVDWVVVNYHWSEDLEAYPTRWQVELAHLAIDQGADLVVGYHPKVLQGTEIYKGRAIAYSLGNFIFTHTDDTEVASTEDYDTAVLKVSLRDNQMRLELLPVEVRQAKPEIVEGEKADQIMQHMQQASSLFEQPMQSPVVLDKRSQDTPPAVPQILVEPSVPELDQPSVPNSEPSQPSDSFITYPDASTPDASTDETQSDSVQPIAPVEPAEPFTTYPSPESDITDDSSEPFHAWPDAQLPDTYPNDTAQVNAVQPNLQAAPPAMDMTSPSPVELTQAEPIQPEQVDQATSLVPQSEQIQSEQIQSEEQVAGGETENVATESDRPPLSAEPLTVLKPQADSPSPELNIKPAL